MMTWLAEDITIPSPEGFDCMTADEGKLGELSTNTTCPSSDGTFGFNYFVEAPA